MWLKLGPYRSSFILLSALLICAGVGVFAINVLINCAHDRFKKYRHHQDSFNSDASSPEGLDAYFFSTMASQYGDSSGNMLRALGKRIGLQRS